MLTQYFYTQMIVFEHADSNLSENIGEMVYGMEVDREKHTASQVVFDREGSSDVLRRVPRAAHWPGPGRDETDARRCGRRCRPGAEDARQ